ncbi:MAG: DNA cytosine methyltransferase [Anaerolineales bacterium]|nr:DNA (cytosine-5-)-methyltransferase [Anaerolineales bacterium]NUQ85264.1 DNA cytosine methyltransferase [Anaerolineales bacterium]
MHTPIPVIDIFAGPGGLGEGFSSFKSKDGEPIFKIKLSIEKEYIEHQTLELRAFYRQFTEREVPPGYYEYLKGNINREELFKMYPMEVANAKREAWQAELGRADRDVVRSRIKEALNGAIYWLLIGGPPCQAYSLAGRSRIIGEDKRKYETDPRHFLYKEYLQILADHQPPVFVMENVKGLLSATLKQQKIFELILRDLQNPSGVADNKFGRGLSYKLFTISRKRKGNSTSTSPEDFIVRSEDYGIPQARHRIIILGVRSDIYKLDPGILEKTTKQVSIDDVIGDLPRVRSGLSKEADSAERWRDAVKSIAEAKWITQLDQSLRQAIISATRKVGASLTRGNSFLTSDFTPNVYREWYSDCALNGICNHETRMHMREDLHRYFFAAVFARKNGRSPTLDEFPEELLPNHRNVQEAVNGSKFNDRFRVQIRGKPATTVVSHISKDGHYYIHYDPSQCRSLTVREAARLQTFPDNYFFEGNRTQQYHQVGNAVPPLLANKIAEIVYNVFESSK